MCKVYILPFFYQKEICMKSDIFYTFNQNVKFISENEKGFLYLTLCPCTFTSIVKRNYTRETERCYQTIKLSKLVNFQKY